MKSMHYPRLPIHLLHAMLPYCRTIIAGICMSLFVIAGSGVAVWYIETLTYQIVIVFLALTFLSNIAAKTIFRCLTYHAK